MAVSLRWAGILLILLITSWKADAIERGFYSALEPGQNITGKIEREIKTRTELECSTSCLITDGCMAYQLIGITEGHCILINSDSTEMTFLSTPENWLYVRDCCCKWSPPPGWSSGLPVVYLSLDSDENLQLHNGAEIVDGKVGNAVKTDRDHIQYVELGDLSTGCIAIPDTCGPEGGAVSLWFKLPSACNIHMGLLTSATVDSSGFIFGCSYNGLGFTLYMETGYFDVAGGNAETYDQWHHFVANLIGPQEGEGIILFLDGNLLVSDTTLGDVRGPAGNGHVQIGRSNTDSYLEYGTVAIDEILFFNRILESDEIEALFKQYA